MLKTIGADIWAYGKEIKLGAGMSMPCRATILRLPDGQLVVHSPLALDDATAKEIDGLGDVRYLIAPNCIHWMFLKAAKERYPKARVFGAPGLAKKLGSFAFEHLPERGEIDGVRGLRVERIQGVPNIEEHAFLHEASRSLIVTDLMFNIHQCRSFGMRCVLRIVGAWKKTSQSRIWRLMVKDRAAAARSASNVLSWDFERVVVAHGEVVEDDARERARQALTWMTSGARPLLGPGSAVA
jgi:hypothetical protein